MQFRRGKIWYTDKTWEPAIITIIKEIEKRLGDDKVTLNSFIVTPTRFAKLNWGKSMDELADMNVLFMEDQKNSYVHQIIERMAA